jgi:hypothetical protein
VLGGAGDLTESVRLWAKIDRCYRLAPMCACSLLVAGFGGSTEDVGQVMNAMY